MASKWEPINIYKFTKLHEPKAQRPSIASESGVKCFVRHTALGGYRLAAALSAKRHLQRSLVFL